MSQNETLPFTGQESPFAVLGIAPTLDLGRVKRAWFAALAKYPPHQDPSGFRRLRTAYEALTAPGGLALAMARSPIDRVAALAAWNERFSAPLARAAEDARRADAEANAIARFIDSATKMTLAAALATWGHDLG